MDAREPGRAGSGMVARAVAEGERVVLTKAAQDREIVAQILDGLQDRGHGVARPFRWGPPVFHREPVRHEHEGHA